MVWDAFLAMVCMLGLAFVGCWLFGLLLRPLPGREARVVLSGQGDGEGLEQMVRSFIWLRGLGLLRCPIVIADLGLSPEGWELASRLTVRWPEVSLWPAANLEDCIRKPEKSSL